jgi:hypothetical protein
MTFQTFKEALLVLVSLLAFTTVSQAQEASIDSIVAKLTNGVKADDAASVDDCVARLQRLGEMHPESDRPAYAAAMQCLSFAIMHPQAPEANRMTATSETLIKKMEQMPKANASDVATLWGFYYMTLIVQNPAQNGPRYYMTVPDYFEKALKLNPSNAVAKELLGKFQEGMKQAMGGQ